MDINALQLAAAAFKSALQAQDRQALIAAARRLIDLDAPLGQQWQGLAQAVVGWGEINLALAALDTWAGQGTAGHDASYFKATILAQVGKARDAASNLAAVPPNAPSPVANAYLQGALALSLGETRTAERQFRRALKAAPDSGRAWLGIAQLGPVSQADEAAMRRLSLSIDRAGIDDRAALATALGIVEHAKGNFAAAFAQFSEANAIRRKGNAYDASDNEASAAVAMSWNGRDICALAQPPAEGTRKPIFVSGVARSGTTLVEQILVSHSAVDGGGELGLALQLEAIADGFGPEHLRAYLDRGGSVEFLRETYLRLVGERVDGAGRFVDKTLNLSRSLGPMSVLFPAAPVVWLRRDPLDNALSIFRTSFSNNVIGSWRLDELAHQMKTEDRLLDHWTNELGTRLLVVPYEGLVDDPRGWIERITNHCGLAVEPQQFAFHLTERSVNTASALQVREPINRRGIGTAEPYRPFMQPFIDAYVC